MNLMTASNQYASRPADERFATLGAMLQTAKTDRELSHEAVYSLRDLRAVAVRQAAIPAGYTDAQPDAIRLAGPKGEATFTHYSFGQLARTIGAPAAYLRTLPPAIAADAINYGLQDAAPIGTKANLLIRDDQAPFPTVRACTSETYGRVWDDSLYGEVNRWFGDGQRANGGTNRVWQSPPVWEGGTGGNYRGDRDSFVLRIDGGSIVNDPSASGGPSNGQMFRGIMIRNSEVGHCSITVDCVLYRYICGNHILWGASFDSRFSRRHVGKVSREAMGELLRVAQRFNDRTASQDEQIIKALIQHEIAHTREGVIDALRKMDKNLTKEAAAAAYDLCERNETASPRSFWGVSQGLTRYSQESGHQDDRLTLDRIAANILQAGIKQYQTA